MVLPDDSGKTAVMEDEAVNKHRSSSPVAIISESASQPSAIDNFDGASKTTDDGIEKDYFGGDTTEAINKNDMTMEEEEDAEEEEEEMMSGQNATPSSRRSTNEESNNSAPSNESSSESIDESNGHDTTFGKGEMTTDSPGDEEEGREHDSFTMVSSGNANHHDESSTLVNNTNQQFLSFLPSSTQSSTNNVTFPTRSSRNEKQDDYVKKGTHVKALLASAMQAVADGFAHNNKATVEDGSSDNNDNNNNSSSNNGDECGAEKKLSKKTAEDFVHMQELAQTKSEECIALKRVSFCLVFNATFIIFMSASFIHYVYILILLSTETR